MPVSDSIQPEVVVVGAMNLDVLAMAKHKAHLDDSTPGRIRFSAGGVGRNIAEALSRLSINCHLHSWIGTDTVGEQLLSLCESAGLNTSRVIRTSTRSTPVYVAVDDAGGNLLHAVSDMALLDDFDLSLMPALQDDISQCDLCVVDANLPESLIAAIADTCGDTPLVADAVSVSKCQKLSSVVPQLHLLKVNMKEAVRLSGSSESLEPVALAGALLAEGASGVLLTLGVEGVMYTTADGVGIRTANAPVTDIVSVNGAGDSMFGGLIAAMLYGYSEQTQLQWGTEAARLSLESESACSDQLSLHSMCAFANE